MVSYRCCSVGPAATRKLYSKVFTLLWSKCVSFSCCLQVTRQRWASQDWKGINSSKLHSTLVNREQFQDQVCDLSCNVRISKKQCNLVYRLRYSEAALKQAKACEPFSKDAENEFEMFIQIFCQNTQTQYFLMIQFAADGLKTKKYNHVSGLSLQKRDGLAEICEQHQAVSQAFSHEGTVDGTSRVIHIARLNQGCGVAKSWRFLGFWVESESHS